jgi:hypothetical protein
LISKILVGRKTSEVIEITGESSFGEAQAPPNVCVSGWLKASLPNAVLGRPKSLPEARPLFDFIAEGLIEGNDGAVGRANL